MTFGYVMGNYIADQASQKTLSKQPNQQARRRRHERLFDRPSHLQLQPRKMGQFLEVFDRLAMPVRLQTLGTPIGFYMSHVGPLNQVVHLWAYEDMTDYERRCNARDTHPDFAAYLKASEGLIVAQEDRLIKRIDLPSLRTAQSADKPCPSLERPGHVYHQSIRGRDNALDVGRMIDKRPMTGYHKLVVFLGFLIIAMDGFDVSVVSFIAAAAAQQLGHYGADAGPGGPDRSGGGPLVDRFGRRGVLLIRVAFVAVWTIATAFTGSVKSW